MGRGLGFVMGMMALAIPVCIAVAIVAMDAWLAYFVMLGFPVSLLALVASYILYWSSSGAAGRRLFWLTPSLLTALTAVAYGIAISLISRMPVPP